MTFKLWALGLALGAVVAGAPAALAQSDGLDRSVLPIPEPPVPVYTELDARNAEPPPRFEVKAPEGAPNVLIVLLDDMGFGQSSAFGGPIHMPTVEALANDGLRYNEFHTTALCSPTRIALLTGRGSISHVIVDLASDPDAAGDEACKAEDDAREKRATIAE